MNRLVGKAALVMILAVTVGCGGDDDDDDDDDAADAAVTIDATAPDIDSRPPLPDAAPCNTLAQTASAVAQTQLDEDPPTATGGGLPDGTYHLIADVVYTGVGGATGPTGLETTSTSDCTALLCDVVESTTVNPTDAHDNWMIEINGIEFNLTQVCGGTGVIGWTHTTETDKVGRTTVVGFEPVGGGTRARTYELQP